MDYKLFATKDNAEGQLDSGISAVSTTISLKAGEGAELPQTYNGVATSIGSVTALNDTGIGASGVAVGDFIYNVTDGSHAFIKTVNTNDIVTTPLQGGSANIWDNSDVWVVNPFVITLNKRNASGVITTSEKVLIQTRATDDLTVWAGGRGYDGSTPASFLADDYVNLFVVSKSAEDIISSLAEMATDISDKADSATVTQLLNNRNWKQSVRVSTTAALTLASDFENGDTVDGIVLATGDRILIKDQAAADENGIYTVNASGAPTRATDFDEAEEATAAVVAVEEGTAQEDTIWLCTDEDPVIDTDPITFVQYGSVNTIASQAEAEAGTNNTKTMTPLRTKEAIDFNKDIQVVAGENIDGTTTPQAVCVCSESMKDEISVWQGSVGQGEGLSGSTDWRIQSWNDLPFGDADASTWAAQSFTYTDSGADAITVENLIIWLEKIGSPTGTIRVEIYDDNSGEPGSLVANGTSDTINASTLLTIAYYPLTFTWATPPEVISGGKYWFVLKRSVVNDGANYIHVGLTTASAYSGHESATYTSSTPAWATSVNDIPCQLQFNVDFGGKIFKADADNVMRSNFIGFTNANTLSGAAMSVIPPGNVIGGFTGLTIGTKYYVSNTAGDITTSNPVAGTGAIQAICGTAISATELLIEDEKRAGLLYGLPGSVSLFQMISQAGTSKSASFLFPIGFKANQAKLSYDNTGTPQGPYTYVDNVLADGSGATSSPEINVEAVYDNALLLDVTVNTGVSLYPLRVLAQ